MNWKRFLHSLIASAAGGALASTTQVITDPGHIDLHHIGAAAGTGALIGMLAYLKEPAPKMPDGPTTNFPTSR